MTRAIEMILNQNDSQVTSGVITDYRDGQMVAATTFETESPADVLAAFTVLLFDV